MNKQDILSSLNKSFKPKETNISRQSIISSLNNTTSDIIKKNSSQSSSIKKSNDRENNNFIEDTYDCVSYCSCED